MKAAISGFLRQVGLLLACVAVVGGYPLYVYGGMSVVWAAAVGCGICVLNGLAGFVATVWAFDKPYAVFMKMLLGGMGVRLLGMGLVFFLVIRFTGIHVTGFTLSLVLFYAVFQALEIRFLVGHLSGREVSKEG